MKPNADTTFDEMLEKINFLEQKNSTEMRERPLYSTVNEFSGKVGINSRIDESKHKSMSASSFNQYKSFTEVSKHGDSQFVDEFCGIKKYSVSIPKEHNSSQKDTYIDVHTRTTNYQIENILNEHYLKFMIRQDTVRNIEDYHTEWDDFKLSFDHSYFSSEQPDFIVWDTDISKFKPCRNIKYIQEFLHSKIHDMNSEAFSTLDDINFTDVDVINLTFIQKRTLLSVFEIAKFLKNHALDITKRNTILYDSAVISFALNFFSQSFLEYLQNCRRLNHNVDSFNSIINDLDPIMLITYFYMGIETTQQDVHIPSDKVPFWFMFYHLIRIGEYGKAIASLKSLDQTFQVLRVILDNLLKDTEISLSQDHIKELQYLSSSRLKASFDEHEKLIISLLTFSNINNNLLKTLQTVEELVWFKLLRIKLSILLNIRAFVNPLLTLQQEIIQDFEHNNDASLLFSESTCLFTLGSFEKAIQHLCSDRLGLIFAVHVAVILYRSHLLEVTISEHPCLIVTYTDDSDTTRNYKINIFQLLIRYFEQLTIPFEVSFIDYFIPFKDLKFEEADIYSLACSFIFRKFSEYNPSLLYNWMENEQLQAFSSEYLNFAKTLAEYCLSIRETYIAFLIYNKINDFDKMLKCLIELLVEIIASPDVYSLELIEDIEKKASELGDKILIDNTLNTPSSYYFLLLLDLQRFFNEFRANRYNNALNIINQLHVVPLDYSQISKCLENISKYSHKFWLIYRHIISNTVTILQKMHESIISKNETGTSDKIEVPSSLPSKRELRDQASAILSFTSQLPFPLSREIRTKILLCLANIRKQV